MGRNEAIWSRELFSKISLSVLVVGFLVGASIVGDAKSMYVIANHHTAQFDAWNINAPGVDPNITYQATYGLTHAGDPAGVAVDSDSETLFITSEGDPGIELVDAKTMKSLDWSDGPSNLGGIDIDEANDTIYSVKRGADDLYVYDWDPGAKTLTLKSGFPKDLPNCSGAFGLALDSTEGVIYVADTSAATVRAYDAATLEEVSSFTPSFAPVGIDVDSQRGLVYTTAPDGSCAGVSLGNTLLSRYDLSSSVETTVDMGHGGMGIAVDEITGHVYVTGGCSGDDISIWDSDLSMIYTSGDIGDPAGIAIGNASYNPLNLAKNDTVVGQGVYVGQQFAYEITYDNADNAFDATGVVAVDRLPVGLDFVSETLNGVPGTGVYDPLVHTVTWDIGTLAAGYTGGEIEIVVSVNQNASSGTTIYNYCEIDSDQTPLTTVVGGDSDNPDPDDPGTDIVVGAPPIAHASDISGQPQTMYADTVYSVTCRYYHASGRDSLKHCLLQLDHPTKSLTMMWYQSTGIYGPWVGEEGANYLTITDVAVTEIINGNEGYELTWRFKINNLWPNAANAIDFGVFASDEGNLESGWDYDDTNGSFSADAGETTSTLPVALVGQKDELIEQLEHLRRWVELYGLSVPIGEVLALAGLPADIDWIGYDAQEASQLLEDWSSPLSPSEAIAKEEALRRLILAEQTIARVYNSDSPSIRGAEGLTSDLSAVVVDIAELFVKPLRVVQKTNQYLHGLPWLSWLHDKIDGLTWHVQNLLGSALVDSVQALLSCPGLVDVDEDVKSLVNDLLEVVRTILTKGTVQILDLGGEVIGSIGTSAVVHWWYVPATQPAENLSMDIAMLLDGAGGYTGLYEDAVDGIEALENAVASKSAALHDTLQILRTVSHVAEALAEVGHAFKLIPGVGTFTLIMDVINIASTAAYVTDAGFSLAYLSHLPDAVEAAVDFSFHPDTIPPPTTSVSAKGLTPAAESVSQNLVNDLMQAVEDAVENYETSVAVVGDSLDAAESQVLESAMQALLSAEDELFASFEAVKGLLQGVSAEASSAVATFSDAYVEFLDDWREAGLARMMFVGSIIEWAGGMSSTQDVVMQGESAVQINRELLLSAEGLLSDAVSLDAPAVLVVSGWAPMPQVISTSDVAHVSVDIRNVGPATAQSVTASLEIDNLTSSSSVTHEVGALASGEEYTLEWSVSPVTEGLATMTLQLFSDEETIVPVGVSRTLSVSNNTAPVVETVHVMDGSDPAMDSKIVQWSASDLDGASEDISISLAYSESGSNEWVVVAQGEANEGVYVWSTAEVPPGTYVLEVMASDIEGATGSGTSEPIRIGASPITEEAGLVVAPNPVSEGEVAFFYNLAANTDEALLQIFSISGRELFLTEIDPMDYRWPSSGFWSPVDEYGVPLANGPYLCVVVADGRVVSQAKMVIQRQ